MGNVIIAIPQMGTDLFRRYMKSKYEKSLNRAGATVKWIELENTDEAVREALECDGLLLPGGADINPEIYGEKATEKCGKPNALRDTAETAIYNEFIKTNKPILAICRGFQLINVLNGGTLYQDIKGEQKCKHSDFLKRGQLIHSVSVKEGSILHKIFESREINVNSIHHQAVKETGEGLTPVCISSDGYVEAIEKENHPFCVGVQWHPEHLSKKFSSQQKLFCEFVKACCVEER